jgi:hypothetical protein
MTTRRGIWAICLWAVAALGQAQVPSQHPPQDPATSAIPDATTEPAAAMT